MLINVKLYIKRTVNFNSIKTKTPVNVLDTANILIFSDRIVYQKRTLIIRGHKNRVIVKSGSDQHKLCFFFTLTLTLTLLLAPAFRERLVGIYTFPASIQPKIKIFQLALFH